MRRARSSGSHLILTVYIGLICPGTVHGQRGRVFEPPPRVSEPRPSERETLGPETGREPPHEPWLTGDHETKSRGKEPARGGGPTKTDNRGWFGRTFDPGTKRTIWERSGCEEPRVETRFRLAHSERLAERRPSGGSLLSPEACVILPKVDAYKLVFQREPTEAEARLMREYETQFREQKVEVLGERRIGEDELKDWVESKARSGGPVVVIGHSAFRDNEQVLALPNGDRVPIEKIHRWAGELGSACVVATCYGKDLGLSEQIRFDDALAMWREAVKAMNQDPSTSLEEFAAKLSRVRWQRGSRSIDLTVSTPGDRPIEGFPGPDGGEIVIWNLPMARPERILMIVALSLTGFGLLHHTMYRVGQQRVGFRPTSPESFRRAMMAAFRHLKASRHTGIAIAGITLVLALSTYLSGTEFSMDWQERRSGGRWQVYVASLVGASFAVLAGAIYLMKPARSGWGALVHGTGGLIVGASTAWFTFCIFSLFVGLLFVLLLTVLGTVVWVVARGERRPFGEFLVGPIGPFLMNVQYLCGFVAIIGCLFAIRGLFDGWRAAIDGSSVHKACSNIVNDYLQKYC